jgi:hypothetical protein
MPVPVTRPVPVVGHEPTKPEILSHGGMHSRHTGEMVGAPRFELGLSQGELVLQTSAASRI